MPKTEDLVQTYQAKPMVERGRTSPKPAPIPNGDVRLAVRLLNDLVTYQESIAETHSFPDGSVGDDPRDRYIVADAKRQAGYARGLVEWLRVRLSP